MLLPLPTPLPCWSVHFCSFAGVLPGWAPEGSAKWNKIKLGEKSRRRELGVGLAEGMVPSPWGTPGERRRGGVGRDGERPRPGPTPGSFWPRWTPCTRPPADPPPPGQAPGAQRRRAAPAVSQAMNYTL